MDAADFVGLRLLAHGLPHFRLDAGILHDLAEFCDLSTGVRIESRRRAQLVVRQVASISPRAVVGAVDSCGLSLAHLNNACHHLPAFVYASARVVATLKTVEINGGEAVAGLVTAV
jgi:hypothetical protein